METCEPSNSTTEASSVPPELSLASSETQNPSIETSPTSEAIENHENSPTIEVSPTPEPSSSTNETSKIEPTPEEPTSKSESTLNSEPTSQKQDISPKNSSETSSISHSTPSPDKSPTPDDSLAPERSHSDTDIKDQLSQTSAPNSSSAEIPISSATHSQSNPSGLSLMFRKMTRRESNKERSPRSNNRRTITIPDIRGYSPSSSATSSPRNFNTTNSQLPSSSPSNSENPTPLQTPPQTPTGNSGSRIHGRPKSPRKTVVSVYSKLGGKHPHNEDRYFFQSLPSPNSNCTGHYFWLGVYDGHGGHDASQYVCEHLHEEFGNSQEFKEERISDALKSSFHNIDEKFLEFENTSGSCAVVAILYMNDHGDTKKIWIGNTGDSRAVLCRNGKGTALSNDHKASSSSERARVSKAGGVVYLGRLFGILAVSRSIGDKELKIRRRGILISDPEVTEHEVTEDGVLVLASDGLWDVLSNEDVGQMLMSTRIITDKTAQLLVEKAAERGSLDDITAIVIGIKNESGGCVIA